MSKKNDRFEAMLDAFSSIPSHEYTYKRYVFDEEYFWYRIDIDENFRDKAIEKGFIPWFSMRTSSQTQIINNHDLLIQLLEVYSDYVNKNTVKEERFESIIENYGLPLWFYAGKNLTIEEEQNSDELAKPNAGAIHLIHLFDSIFVLYSLAMLYDYFYISKSIRAFESYERCPQPKFDGFFVHGGYDEHNRLIHEKYGKLPPYPQHYVRDELLYWTAEDMKEPENRLGPLHEMFKKARDGEIPWGQYIMHCYALLSEKYVYDDSINSKQDALEPPKILKLGLTYLHIALSQMLEILLHAQTRSEGLSYSNCEACGSVYAKKHGNQKYCYVCGLSKDKRYHERKKMKQNQTK